MLYSGIQTELISLTKHHNTYGDLELVNINIFLNWEYTVEEISTFVTE